MDDFLHRAAQSFVLSSSGLYPPVDVYETASAIVVMVEIAGVSPDALEVVLERGVLLVRGERLEQPDPGKQRLMHMEIAYGPFERQIVLPSGVAAEGVRAHYRQGLLRIEIPKAGRGPDTGRIPIT